LKYSYDKGDYDGARKFIAAVNWEENLRNLPLEELSMYVCILQARVQPILVPYAEAFL